MSEEYYIPTVKSESQKVPAISDSQQNQRYHQDEDYSSQQYSQSYQQSQQNQKSLSQKSPNPTTSTYTRNSQKQSRRNYNIIENDENAQLDSHKPSKKGSQYSQQNSRQIQDLNKPISYQETQSRPSTSHSYASQVSQKHYQGQQGLLEWDVVETQHKQRDPKKKYSKGQQLISRPDMKHETDKYFKNTRVTTCSKVVVQNGVAKAVASYQKPPSNSFQKSKQLNVTKSLAQENYAKNTISKCGDRKKPLTPYDPNASRNKLPTKDVKMPHKNHSTVQLGSQEKDKKHFLSTKQNQQGYKNTKHFDHPNPGINAYRTTWYKKQENK